MINLISRFLVPALFLLVICSTGVHGQCFEAERQSLLNIKRDLKPMSEYDVDPLPSWEGKGEASDCCKWRGVACSNKSGHVTMLDLSPQTLSGVYDYSLLTIDAGKISFALAKLQHLEYLDISYIYLNASHFQSSITTLTKLEYLNLSDCGMSGEIPPQIGNLSRLKVLDLRYNFNLRPTSLDWVSRLSSLRKLDLSFADLSKTNNQWFEMLSKLPYLTSLELTFCDLPKFIIPSTLSVVNASTSLVTLDLSYNDLAFPLHQLTLFNFSRFLIHLDLSYNSLVGSIPESIWQLRELEELNLGNNFLEGVISEAHFSKLSKLTYLDISFNSITLNIRSNWTPPFQLDVIGLASCNLNSDFPKWLSTQTNYSLLNLYNSGISGPIPSWFWGTISEKCIIIILSNNKISGTIETSYFPSFNYPSIHLDSNQLDGLVPRFLFNVGMLNLSMNQFSNLNSLCGVTEESNLTFLDISHNNLSGELPDCWSHFKSLGALRLGNNWFSGKIPVSIGSLTQIKSLHLENNNLIGELPLSLKNLLELSVFDVGENNLSGPIPPWMGKNMSSLLILSLRSNHFSGSISPSLCDLEKLQILDLSQNQLSMNIPNCLGYLTAMEMHTLEGTSIFQEYFYGPADFHGGISILDELQLFWKGKPSSYSNTLGLVKVLDLSSNNLIGTIPPEITGLDGLVSLNLSRNKLSGEIPFEIGKLENLEVLDFSNNQLSGFIPQSLSQVDRLSLLDISNNNLSGEIPTSTQLQSFPASSYWGNPELCGPPLRTNCSGEEPRLSTHHNRTEDEDRLITRGFYVSVALGILVGFWGVCGTLIFKRSWR